MGTRRHSHVPCIQLICPQNRVAARLGSMPILTDDAVIAACNNASRSHELPPNGLARHF